MTFKRFTIPAGTQPSDLSPVYTGFPAVDPETGEEYEPHRPAEGARYLTWQELADQAGCDEIVVGPDETQGITTELTAEELAALEPADG